MTKESAEEIGRRIGQRLKAARQSQRYTQERLAEAAGLSVDVIRKIERGKTARLDLSTYSSLARVLRVDTQWFQPNENQNKQLVPTPQFDIMFVHRTIELDLISKSANLVRQTKSARIKALVNNIAGYVDHMSADGRIGKIALNKGALKDERTEGGEIFLSLQFLRPLKIDEETDIRMSFDLHNSFRNLEEEYWSIRVTHPTDLVRLIVRFHPERPYRSYLGLERFTTHESICAMQPTNTTLNGKATLMWEIKSPSLGHTYKLSWKW